MSNELIPFQDQQRMAESIVKSKFYGFTDINQVMAVMIVAQAENKHPGTVVQEYDIIQGRPALKSQAILARFQQAGGKVEYVTYTDDEVKMTFTHPAGGSLTLAWTMKQAAAIGLASKDNWKKYPRAMLKARVVAEGVRAVYPACILGHYAVEEAIDFDPKPQMIKPVPQITEIEIVDELEYPKPHWPFYVPKPDGSLKLYKACTDADDFMGEYSAMVEKICASKLSGEQQDEKIEALKEANRDMLEKVRNSNG